MEKRFLVPKEIVNATINAGITKGNIKTKNAIVLGILAGIFIGFGGLASSIISQTLGGIDAGLSKFAGAAVFPVGLMLVVIAGAELFTGNNLMVLAYLNKKINSKQLFRNWALVWVANLIGSLLLVLIVYWSGLLVGDAGVKTISTAQSKATLTIGAMFTRAIMCNIMVVLAVWIATSAQDIISKIFACWFPIMLFVLCGFEHSVANMFFIPMGMVLGANVTMAQCVTNIIIVTLGNIVGGALFIPFMYHHAYLVDDKKIEEAKN